MELHGKRKSCEMEVVKRRKLFFINGKSGKNSVAVVVFTTLMHLMSSSKQKC